VLGVVCGKCLRDGNASCVQVGWEEAEFCMRDCASRLCNGYPLRERFGFVTANGLTYRFQCGFFNYLKCEWQLRVIIPYNQPYELAQYRATHPDVPESTVINAIAHTSATMSLLSAKSGMRPAAYKSHLCYIETTGTHKPHNSYQKKHAHCMFQAYCKMHPFALRYGRAEITTWLRNENIQTKCVQVDPDTGETTSVDHLTKMVSKCKRYCEAQVKKLDGDMDTCNPGKDRRNPGKDFWILLALLISPRSNVV